MNLKRLLPSHNCLIVWRLCGDESAGCNAGFKDLERWVSCSASDAICEFGAFRLRVDDEHHAGAGTAEGNAPDARFASERQEQRQKRARLHPVGFVKLGLHGYAEEVATAEG